MDDTERGVYYANIGPPDGPMRAGRLVFCSGLFLTPKTNRSPDGIAYPAWQILDRQGPVATWRLELKRGGKIPGLWVCDSRRFVPAEEWAERQAIREFG